MQVKLLGQSLPVQRLLMISGLLLILLLLVNRLRAGNRSSSRKLSKDFTLGEFLVTDTGLDNTPDSASVRNIERHVKEFFQPLRDSIDKPIIINSGFRSPRVNRAVGGVKDSKHMTGDADDFRVDGKSGQWLASQIVGLGFTDYEDLLVHDNYVHIEF